MAIDEYIVTEAARLQVEHRLDVWNALHLSCARSGGARFFVTTDHSLPALPEMECIFLDSIQV